MVFIIFAIHLPMLRDERDQLSSAYRDHFDWCQQSGRYIKQDDLVNMLQRKEKILVIDVRDDDHRGGKVTGSVHFPDSTFWDNISDVASQIQQDTTVVFHCMESARRGPRCAFRLHKYLGETQPQLRCNICVLTGGADRWVRRFFKDSALVEDFDNDYWGWDLQADEVQSGQPTHVLYSREAGEYPEQQ